MDLSDIVMLCSWPNSCCQQNLKCFDMPLLSLGLFYELLNRFKDVLQTSAWQCVLAFF